jgi:phenylpropionate dioxygenase-like ring-hydroxylating dioxygenase large terminal subunit
MLKSYFYTSPKIFDKEINKIYIRHWLFFGLTQEFVEDHSYLRKRLYNHDFFVTKSGESYRAFYNVCPHRFSPIVDKDAGKTVLTCPYHAWSFKEDGKIKSIPYEKDCYQFNSFTKNSLGLESIHIKKIGSLLFINFAKNPMSFDRQFKKNLIDDLHSMSNTFTDFKKITLTKRCNWKLIQENLRDGLHPIFLHKNTILKRIKFGLPGIAKNIPYFLLRLKDASFGGPDVDLIESFDLRNKFKNPWPCDSRYYNYFLFPNLHIALPDGGYTFVLENFIPISEDETKIELFLITTKSLLSSKERDDFFGSLETNAMKVYEEDFKIFEDIQLAIKQKKVFQSHHGRYENMLQRFHKIYLNKLSRFSFLDRL